MKIFFDFVPIILFFVAYKVAGIYVATAVAMAASLLQTGLYWVKHRRFEKMHVVVLFLILVLGGATLVFHDPVFIKWKPTVVNWAFAAVFLGSEFVGQRNVVQRIMTQQITLPDAVWRRLNFAWVAFFIVSGALNIYAAYNFSESAWVNFKLFGMLGLTIAFVVAQSLYLIRHIPDDQQQVAVSDKKGP